MMTNVVLGIVLVALVARLAYEFAIASKTDRKAYTIIAVGLMAAYIIIELTYKPSEPFKPYW